MLVELLRLSGGEGAELLRRWVAALMNAPPAERRSIVEAVEQRIVEVYDSPPAPAEEPLLHIVGKPTPKGDFTEVVVRSYSAQRSRKKSAKPARRRTA